MTQKEASPTKEDVSLKAKSDALRLLSFKPRSVEELRGRLRMKKYTDPVIEETLASLKRQGLLDDEKFAKLFAHASAYTRPSGKKRLAFELKRKGVAQDLVTKTLEGLESYDEKEAALQLVRGRFQKMTGVSDQKKKTRLFGFLKRRGFSNDVIFSALSTLIKDALDEN